MVILLNSPIKKYKLLNKQVFAKSDIIGNNGFFIGLPTKKINKKFIDKLVKFFEKVYREIVGITGASGILGKYFIKKYKNKFDFRIFKKELKKIKI